ncbi:MAG: hypothetical protein GX374_08670 [Bacilli bacterium]|nr:hypothetical protein [Bacilli bacterium]
MGKMVHNNINLEEINARTNQQMFSKFERLLLQLKVIDDKYSNIIKDRFVHINNDKVK